MKGESRPAEDPDVRLMLRLKGGDRAAFEELLQRNTQAVFHLAYRYLRDRDRAEDVVQETFLRVYRNRERYRPSARFSSWLLRIAANLCLSALRRRRMLSIYGDGRDEGERNGAGDIPDPAVAAPDEGLLQDEMQRRVHAAMDALPERQRVAVLLSKFHERSYQEIGEILGLSVPAVKSLLHRARNAMRRELEGYILGAGGRGGTATGEG